MVRKGYHNYCIVQQFKKKYVCCYEKPREFFNKAQITLKPKKLEFFERINNYNSRIILSKEAFNKSLIMNYKGLERILV